MIKIEKKISLGFISEEYKDSFVVLSAIPMKDYPELQAKIEAVQGAEDNQKAMEFMVSIVVDNFIRGEIKQGEKNVELTADNLVEMPGEFFLGVIENLLGRNPKE